MTAAEGNKRRRRLIALGLSSILSLVVAEVVLRVAAPQPTFAQLSPGSPRCFRPSVVAPWELLPHAEARLVRPEFDHPIRINGQGFRMDREVDLPSENRRRVVVIGDSFTFGHGVEAAQAYPQQLEQRLAAEQAEVLNLGFAYGFSPDAYYAGLKRDGERIGGSVLVVGVFVGNDLTAGVETRWLASDPEGLPTRVAAAFTYVDEEHRSRPIDTLWRYRVPVLRDSHLLVGLARLLGSGQEPLAARYASALRQMHTPQLYEPTWPPGLEEVVGQQLRCLGGLEALALERGQKLLVVLIPHARQVYHLRIVGEGEAQTLEVTLRQTPGAGAPQARVRTALSRAAVLDLLPPFVAAQDKALYYHQDGHWTAKGHALAADLIAAELRRRGWLPR